MTVVKKIAMALSLRRRLARWLGVLAATTSLLTPLQTSSQSAGKPALSEETNARQSNSWTIGLAAGLPEGTFLPFAAEVARNLNRGGQIRVLPIVTSGATDNVRDLIYLKGIDVGITHTDVLEHFKTVEKIAQIDRRIRYIAGLYASEVHIVARAEFKSLRDLAGKRVGFHTKGSGSTVTAPIIFGRLGIKVEPVYLSNAVAIEKMRTGEISAIVHNGGKPNNMLARFRNDADFKFLEVPIDGLDDYYVPASLTSEDYPNFLRPGERIETIAVPALLAVYNWPASSDRGRRVERFIEMFFDRFEGFKEAGYQPQWKDINLAAAVPGWTRHPRAEMELRKPSSPLAIEPTRAGRRSSSETIDAPQAARLMLPDRRTEMVQGERRADPFISAIEQEQIPKH